MAAVISDDFSDALKFFPFLEIISQYRGVEAPLLRGVKDNLGS
jgi:hypothetical protein